MRIGLAELVQLTASEDTTGRLFDTLEGHTDLLTAVTFIPETKTTLKGHTATGETTDKLEGHTDFVTSATFIPKELGQVLAARFFEPATKLNGKVSIFRLHRDLFLPWPCFEDIHPWRQAPRCLRLQRSDPRRRLFEPSGAP